jgi:signal transduction histidine kinase
MLTIINATVSHELRNPLNSIISLNYENNAHISQIDQILKKDIISVEDIKTLKNTCASLKNCNMIQESSSNLMIFLVQDILDYA